MDCGFNHPPTIKSVPPNAIRRRRRWSLDSFAFTLLVLLFFTEFNGYRGPMCKIWPLKGWDINSEFLPTIDDAGIISLSEALARGMKQIPDGP